MSVRPAAPDYAIPVPARLAAVLEQLGRPVTYVARGGVRDGALVELARTKRADLLAS